MITFTAAERIAQLKKRLLVTENYASTFFRFQAVITQRNTVGAVHFLDGTNMSVLAECTLPLPERFLTEDVERAGIE